MYTQRERNETVCVDVGMLCDHTNININSVIASVQISAVSSAGMSYVASIKVLVPSTKVPILVTQAQSRLLSKCN